MATPFSATALDALSRAQSAGTSSTTPSSKVEKAAKDFEALLLGQILRFVHEGGGWLGTGSDESGDAAIGLGEEQLARTMANSGGLGLSKLIEAGLRNEQNAADSARQTAAAQAAAQASPASNRDSSS